MPFTMSKSDTVVPLPGYLRSTPGT